MKFSSHQVDYDLINVSEHTTREGFEKKIKNKN